LGSASIDRPTRVVNLDDGVAVQVLAHRHLGHVDRVDRGVYVGEVLHHQGNVVRHGEGGQTRSVSHDLDPTEDARAVLGEHRVVEEAIV
jgi:hypothetical protein